MRTVAIGLAMAAALAASAAERPPPWRTYAVCAAAYEVNAAIVDPQRPASMRADMGEVAGDYRKAALKALRAARTRPPGKPERIVGEIIAAERQGLAGASREGLDALIETCPQPDGAAAS